MKRKNYEKLCKWRNKIDLKLNLAGKYTFVNRQKGSENMFYILAGYKPDLWDNVFSRVKEYVPEDFDVCILSSGRYVERLEVIAEQNNWSYLYTKKNIVSNVQNIAISQFPKAQFIWKMDEDMFLCKDYFKIMQETREKALKELDYEIGFVAPLIPINSYGYMRFLSKCNAVDEYERQFGEAKIGFNKDNKARHLWSKEAQVFLWELTGNIDQKALEINSGKREYSICAGRFSIGAIMFTRRVWWDMGMFERDRYICDGRDESCILQYCMRRSRVIVVAEDALVGHHSLYNGLESVKKLMSEGSVKYI